MAIHLPTLLEGILEATADEAAAKARLATLRAALEDEARRRYAAEGAAPSWATPSLGKVRLEPETPWAATVSDPAAFGSWVAEHHPTEATAVIAIPAVDLADALQALEFIQVDTVGEVRVEVRSAWEEAYVKALTVDVEENTDDVPGRTFTIVDDQGLMPDGLTGTRKPAKLVVSLDRDRRTAAINRAQGAATALVEGAQGDDPEAPDLAELDTRRRVLEGLHGDQLAAIAKTQGLGASGTKAALAERIARHELATGHVIRPAATVTAPEPLPEDVEVEEVTVVEQPDQGRIIEGLTAPEGAYAPGGTVAVAIAGEVARAQAAEELAEEGAARTVGEHIAEERAASLLDGLSREVLRGYAKSVGISAAGTKAEQIARLVEAGTTVTDVNDYARAARA